MLGKIEVFQAVEPISTSTRTLPNPGCLGTRSLISSESSAGTDTKTQETSDGVSNNSPVNEKITSTERTVLTVTPTSTPPAGIVDSHVHLLPDRLAQAVRGFFDQHINSDLAYSLNNRETLDRLTDEGVAAVWNLPYAHRSGIAAALNQSMLELATKLEDHPVEIVSGCTVHPEDPDPVGDFHHAIDQGARVLKLHCSVGAYQPDDSRLTSVLELAASRRIPVVIHAGKAISGFTNSHDLTPIGVVARRHPETTFVLAHFGHDALKQGIELLDQHPNLMADLTPVLHEMIPIDRVTAERFADRLLFGSDCPNTGCTVSGLNGRLQSLQLSPSVHDKIVRSNARALLDAQN